MKRLGIFCFYDEDGIVDRYVDYLLNDISDNLEDLIIVCNGTVNEEGQAVFEKYTDKVVYRDNRGYDAAAFKYIILEKLSKNQMLLFDEMVFFNATFYGPFYPLRKMFSVMDNRTCDFWGVTKHSANDAYPEHIQTYFYVIRKRLFLDEAFKEFWETQNDGVSVFSEAINGYEIRLTQFFKKKGFTYDVYVDLSQYDSANTKYNFNVYGMLPYELIRYNMYPFLKKKVISFYNDGNNAKALTYIENVLKYDTGMIWENALRNFGATEIQRALGKRFVIEYDNEANYIGQASKKAVFIYFENFIWNKYFESVLDNISDYIDVFFIVSLEDELEKLNKYINSSRVQIVKKENWSVAKTIAFASEKAASYDYVCVLNSDSYHAERIIKPKYLIFNEYRRLFDNLLCSISYVNKVVTLFEKDKYLGVLLLPYYVDDTFSYSRDIYDRSMKLIRDKYGIKVRYERQMDHSIPPGAFWCRSSVLVKAAEGVRNIELDDISCRISVPYLAQNMGLYSASLHNKESLEETLTVQERIIEHCICCIKTANSTITDVGRISNPRIKNHLLNYCSSFDKVYIYGTGLWGEQCYCEIEDEGIKNIKGYIISDGHVKREEFHGFPVYYLSNIEIDADTGIVVALDEKYYNEVTPLLEKKGCFNYLWYL